MKDFDALKNIWHGQAARPKMNYDDLLKQIKRSKNAVASKLLGETIGMAAVMLFFVSIWIFQPFLMWTSHLSLLILILCCFYYLFVQFRDYRSISNSESLFQRPDEYISFLKKYQQHRYSLNTRKYAAYSLFIGLAFVLYFVEVYFAAPLWQAVSGAVFTILWFIICAWLMRNYIRKEQDKLNDIIEKLENLGKQFKD